jgi:single-strand DNA-binding protein
MSGYLNRASIIGNLGQDPESRVTQAGKTIVSFSVATTESWTDSRSGERKEQTEWHRVVIFNEGLALIAAKYLRKGAKVLVEGKLSTRKWQDQAGNERYTTEIQLQPYNGILTFLDKKPAERDEAGETRAPARERANAGDGARASDAPKGVADLDADVPF